MALKYKKEIDELYSILEKCNKGNYTVFLTKKALDRWLTKVVDRYTEGEIVDDTEFFED